MGRTRIQTAGSLVASGLLALALAGRAGADVPHLDHVIVVVLENKSYDETRVAPYTASLITQYASFSNSHAITHPSQPNYLAMWAGLLLASNDNCPPLFSPYYNENLGSACETAGLRWRAYSEDLPAVGSSVCSSGLYLRRHCPWTDFGNLNHDNERTYPDLASDIANDSVPALSYVIPNNCNNSHNAGCTVTTADTWLQNNVPAMISAVGQNGLVVITWDEDDFGASNQILTVFCGPRVKQNYISTRYINHYSVLRTITETLGLPAFGQALNDSVITDVWAPTASVYPVPPPTRIELSPPRPNPTSGGVSATLALPAPMAIEAAVYDIAGRPVRHLESGVRSGVTEIRWDGLRDDGRRARAGVYLLRVRTPEHVVEQRVTLIH